MVELATELKKLLPEKDVRLDAEALSVWGVDRTTSFGVAPGAVVFPRSVEDVVRLVAAANTRGFSLVPSGGRTGLSGGAVAGGGEVVVSLDRMNAILDFSASDRLVTCQAGLVTAELQAFAEEQGLFYPVDFASSGSSQIGGNISTNAGGIKVIRYGLTRDWVAGLTVVTGRGEVLSCNHGLIKNATGYDLRHLFIGAEGTLGIIVEAQMRLAPAPEPQRVMVLGVDRFRDILKVLSRFESAIEISAFEFFSELSLQKVIAHRDAQRPFGSTPNFYALIEFDASAEPLALELFEACVIEGWVGDAVLSQSDAQVKSLWQLREDISESLSPYKPYKNDVAVRIADVPDFLDEVDALVNQRYPDLEVCWYGHIGDGNLHLNILKPDALSVEAFYERCHHISPELFELVAQRSGSISAEHGVGLLKKDFLGYSRSDEEIAAMRGIKSIFDPRGVMNPGKLLTA